MIAGERDELVDMQGKPVGDALFVGFALARQADHAALVAPGEFRLLLQRPGEGEGAVLCIPGRDLVGFEVEPGRLGGELGRGEGEDAAACGVDAHAEEAAVVVDARKRDFDMADIVCAVVKGRLHVHGVFFEGENAGIAVFLEAGARDADGLALAHGCGGGDGGGVGRGLGSSFGGEDVFLLRGGNAGSIGFSQGSRAGMGCGDRFNVGRAAHAGAQGEDRHRRDDQDDGCGGSDKIQPQALFAGGRPAALRGVLGARLPEHRAHVLCVKMHRAEALVDCVFEIVRGIVHRAQLLSSSFRIFACAFCSQRVAVAPDMPSTSAQVRRFIS